MESPANTVTTAIRESATTVSALFDGFFGAVSHAIAIGGRGWGLRSTPLPARSSWKWGSARRFRDAATTAREIASPPGSGRGRSIRLEPSVVTLNATSRDRYE